MLAPKTIGGGTWCSHHEHSQNIHVLIMQDFEGVGFGWCLGLGCSYLGAKFWFWDRGFHNEHFEYLSVFQYFHRICGKLGNPYNRVHGFSINCGSNDCCKSRFICDLKPPPNVISDYLFIYLVFFVFAKLINELHSQSLEQHHQYAFWYM